MTYGIKKQKRFENPLLKNKSLKLQLSYFMLNNRSYKKYGTMFFNLSNKKQEEIALEVAKEYDY